MEELNKKKKVWDGIKVLSFFLIGLGFILVWGMSGSGEPPFLGIILLLVPGGILLFVATSKIKEISNEFKTTFVKKEIEKRIPHSTFHINSGISSSIVSESNLVLLQDRYSTEDLLEGKIENVDFRCADVHVQDVRGSGKNRRVVTTFKGRFYEFEFFKHFKSNVFLLQPGQYRPFTNFQKVQLESIKFNSEFKIYTNNEHDVFYLLTPHLMEKLLILDGKYRDKIGFSFLNSKLYIAIDTRLDTFDVTGMGEITQLDIDKAIQEIENIIEFVEFLNLTSTLFIENN